MNKKTKKKKYRSRKGKLYKLSKYKNKEIWRKASKKDVKCNDYLQKKLKRIYQNIKKGNIKVLNKQLLYRIHKLVKNIPDVN